VFSSRYKELKYNYRSSSVDINNILNKAANLNSLNSKEILDLLNSNIDLKILQKIAFYITKLRFGNTIKLYTPLYYSNECINSCLYCGFNKANNIKRTTLSVEEVVKEAIIISKQGIKHILLVAGESNNIGIIEELLVALKAIFASIVIEIAPLSVHQYEKLYTLGLTGVTSYQETYNKTLYNKYHVLGPKKDFNNRLDTLDRAGKAKMRILGLGSLLGLNDYKEELYFIIEHALYLQKKYWQSQLNISFPRIRKSHSTFKVEHSVSDEELLRMISILRIILPDANLVLSTRECVEFRNLSLNYGITQFSAGSKTSPLGYSTNDYSEQFSISDNRTVEELSLFLKNNNYDSVFKDWDKEFINE